MGSGRGQTRRAAAQTLASWSKNEPRDVAKTWASFVTENKLTDVTIASYYNIEPAAMGGASAITYEILRDLVAISAVSLPKGATVEGLKPEISSGWDGEKLWIGKTQDVLILTTRNPRARRRKAIVECYPYDILQGETKMGSRGIQDLAVKLGHATNILFDLSEGTEPLYVY